MHATFHYAAFHLVHPPAVIVVPTDDPNSVDDIGRENGVAITLKLMTRTVCCVILILVYPFRL